MRKNIYLYPITARNRTGVSNPYVLRLAEVLSRDFLVVNRHYPSDRGIMDAWKYIRKVDVLYLNWIENLPSRHLGLLQSLLFLLLALVCRIRGIRIVWTLHNRGSHGGPNLWAKRLLFRFMRHRSDLVITHAREGLDLLPARTRGLCLPHPVTSAPPSYRKELEHDILIWGTIAPYKGVDEFIKYLHGEGILSAYRIVIAGKVVDKPLQDYLDSLCEKYETLSLLNRFVPEPELVELMNRSGVILFTYHAESILSSGALMDTLVHNTNILGPDTGAFRDLAELKLIRTYTDHADLVRQVDLMKTKEYREPFRMEQRKVFIDQNSWEAFGKRISQVIKEPDLRNS